MKLGLTVEAQNGDVEMRCGQINEGAFGAVASSRLPLAMGVGVWVCGGWEEEEAKTNADGSQRSEGAAAHSRGGGGEN